MSLARFAHCSLLSLALFASNACSDDAASPADEDLPAHVSIQVGTKGGTLKASGGLTLEIPEGALDKNVKISATNAGQTAPKEIQAKQVSDLYEFGPEGTKFNKDVKIVFHTAKEEQRAEVYFTKEDGSGFEKIASQKNGKEVTAFVKHFSQGFVGVPLDDAQDAGELEEPDAGREEDAGLDLDAGEPMPAMDGSTKPTLDAGQTLDTSMPDPVTDAGVSTPSDASASTDTSVDAAPPKIHIVVLSRDISGTLVNQTWAAFQDGQGAWQALAPSTTAGLYEFDVINATYGVAFVCATPNMSDSWNTISFSPTLKTSITVTTQGPPCTVGTPPATVNVQGQLTLTPDTYWRIGHSQLTGGAGSYAGGPADFSTNLLLGVTDDVLFATGPTASYMTINRILVRRDQTFYANTTGFNSSMDAGVAPASTMQAQVLNASANTYLEVHYTTRNTEDGLLLNTTDTTGTSTISASFATLPEGLRRSTDRYLLLAHEMTSSDWRRVSLSTYPTGNLSVALPPAFTTSFSPVTTPYLRPSFTFTPLTGASTYSFSSVYSPVRNSEHAFTINVDPAWLSGTGTTTLTFPDFSAVPGFQSAWVAPSNASVSAKSAVYVKKSDASGDLKSESGQSATVPLPPQ
jgi:ZU5 domain